jgi:hypothetical protein
MRLKKREDMKFKVRLSMLNPNLPEISDLYLSAKIKLNTRHKIYRQLESITIESIIESNIND